MIGNGLYVNDANALRGIPVLLENTAATCWIGIEGTITDLESAVTAFCEVFCVNCLILHEQSKDENSELYLCNIPTLIIYK